MPTAADSVRSEHVEAHRGPARATEPSPLPLLVEAALDAQLRRDAGPSHFEYQILAVLSMTETRTLPMSDMAGFTESSLSRLSHACRRLEAQGWVERSPHPDDGRVTLATLTDAGYAKVVDAAPGHVRTVRSLVFDPLTKQQVEQLGRALARVQARIGSNQRLAPDERTTNERSNPQRS